MFSLLHVQIILKEHVSISDTPYTYLMSLSKFCCAVSCLCASWTLPSIVNLAHSWAQWTPNTDMFRLPAHTQLDRERVTGTGGEREKQGAFSVCMCACLRVLVCVCYLLVVTRLCSVMMRVTFC